MQKSSPKPPAAMAGAISIMKPPKAPCWRDFVVPSGHAHIDTGDPTIKPIDPAECGRGASPSGSKSGKSVKRVRARLHRTRSEHMIHEADLPEEALTVTLAETKPREFGLGRQFLDDKLYLEENTRRCQNWLASIEACEPLDTIAYTQGENLEGVDVEIPEESNRWVEETEELKPPFNTSASSSEDEENDIPGYSGGKLIGVPHTVDFERHNLLRLATAQDVHHKLGREKILSIPEDSGLE